MLTVMPLRRQAIAGSGQMAVCPEREEANTKLEKYKIPRAIEAVEVLIKTFNGKTDRKAYRKKVKG